MISSERLALRLCFVCYAFAFAATLLEAPLLFGADIARTTLLRCTIGIAASCIGVIHPNVLSAFAQLTFYQCIQKDGGRWFGYAWETQLDETGLICLVLALAPEGPSWLAGVSRYFARLALHVLAFRVMLAAGLLKMRANEQCWKDHTCLYYHFTTTPQPTPLSYYAAQLPKLAKGWMQWSSIDVAELVLPFGFLLELPRMLLSLMRLPGFGLVSSVLLLARWIAAVGTLGLMMGIQATGNYSFLQLLTAIPCAAALGIHGGRDAIKPTRSPFAWRIFTYPRAVVALALTIALGSTCYPGFVWLMTGSRRARTPVPWVTELIGGGATFSSGRFASMTKERDEPSIHVLRCYEKEQRCGEQCADASESSLQPKCDWVEVDINCKVGSVSRAPCFTSPLHRRFAWQWWFIGLGGDTQWLERWLDRVKRGEVEAWLPLEATDDDTWNVRAITVRMHRYEWNFDKEPTHDVIQVEGYPLMDRADGTWWSRSRGRTLITVRTSTKWKRHASIVTRWWSAV